jgi:hypothetical protein
MVGVDRAQHFLHGAGEPVQKSFPCVRIRQKMLQEKMLQEK